MDESYSRTADLETFATTDSTVSADDLTVAPDSSPCWAGDWARVPVRTQVWAQGAVLRTVGALPGTHPWRLGGTAGSVRQLQWSGRPATVPGDVLGILSITAVDPGLSAADGPDEPGDGVTDALRRLGLGREQQWAGALVRLPGTWLPAAALLPRGLSAVPAPRTSWATESIDFDRRWVVQTDDERTTAALLSPSVMSVLMDAVPAQAAVTVAGDALQVWWPYGDQSRSELGRVQRAALAALLLVKTFPRFVLADHPDRSAEIERSLARRADEAHAYQAHLAYGRSPDPVLQRIYDQARAGLMV
jgi:hypothetical protein